VTSSLPLYLDQRMFRWTKIQAFDVRRVVFSYVPVVWVIFITVFLIIL
jgi:hypothetical protein